MPAAAPTAGRPQIRASPALPIGAFAYSQGLERAVANRVGRYSLDGREKDFADNALTVSSAPGARSPTLFSAAYPHTLPGRRPC